MNRIRTYVPLIAFVVPTVIIGYGFVIPRSCIAGVNELTIGFGTTILGAILTYFAGQKAVMPPRVCTKPPLSVRIFRMLNRQASSPTGFFGRILGGLWRREHARLNPEVLDQLDLQPGQRVLEIGPGPGEALREAARRAHGGHVLGLDVSDVMVNMARKRNEQAIARGEVEVRAGDVASFAFEDASFDRIFSVHTIYFWRDVEGVLAKLAAALRPGGKLVLAFLPEGENVPARLRDPVYKFPRIDEFWAAMNRAGLVVERAVPSVTSPHVLLVTASQRREGEGNITLKTCCA